MRNGNDKVDLLQIGSHSENNIEIVEVEHPARQRHPLDVDGTHTSIPHPLRQLMLRAGGSIRFHSRKRLPRHSTLPTDDALSVASQPQASRWIIGQLTGCLQSLRSDAHRQQLSSKDTVSEYPHAMVYSSKQEEDTYAFRSSSEMLVDEYIIRRRAEIAAAFLRDYEASRPPSLPPSLSEITEWHLKLHKIKFGTVFSGFLFLATLGLCVSSLLEGGRHRLLVTTINFVAIAFFGVDVWISRELRGHGRKSGGDKLEQPMIALGIVLSAETAVRQLIPFEPHVSVFLSSFFKPLVFFYVSRRAWDAFEAVQRIFKIVFKVIIMELLLILMFAAIACRLYSDYRSFRDLSNSWLSLFELATTVVSPSVWMPMYDDSKYAAIFFVVFIITAVFYLHSLVLSVVFKTYIRAASAIHGRSLADREHALHLAYSALSFDNTQNVIKTSMARRALAIVRPSYNEWKVNALVQILDPTNQNYVDYPTFRSKIRQALNSSIRPGKRTSSWALVPELVAILVAVSNFIYVILVSSTFDEAWFNEIQFLVGNIITLCAGTELLLRCNPCSLRKFKPTTRLNAAFDGLACVATVTSLVGIAFQIAGKQASLHLLLMGRAIDMIRIMRYFRIFRDVMRRSYDVIPALIGPTVLVISTLHVFVYIGIALWGGAIHVGAYDGIITPLYDLNNFNSYQEGLVTMFQVLVVNDWHAIAQVFLHADRCSSPYIVFPFFVAGNLIGVSIMLNVLTAFFVASFVTEIDDMEHSSSLRLHRREDHFASIHQSDGSSSHRANASARRYARAASSDADESSESNELSVDSDSEYDFDVFEREGFDKIMQTVAGGAHRRDFARDLCQYLEIYEGLTPERDSVGYLICDQQTLERFGNRRFQVRAEGFLPVNELHVTVSEMHAELMQQSLRGTSSGSVLDAGARSVTRVFPHCDDPGLKLEISAALLREHPAVSLFVARESRPESRDIT